MSGSTDQVSPSIYIWLVYDRVDIGKELNFGSPIWIVVVRRGGRLKVEIKCTELYSSLRVF